MRAKPRENGANDADGAVSSESEEEGAVPNAVVEREARDARASAAAEERHYALHRGLVAGV